MNTLSRWAQRVVGKRVSLLIYLALASSTMHVTLCSAANAKTLFTEDFHSGLSSPNLVFSNDGFANMLAGAVSPLGDYNRNGIVDAADYTVWRDTFGTSVYPGFGADGNNSGVVDPFDRLVWRANYGRIRSGSGPSIVPEPGAINMGITAVVLGVVLLRCRR